MTRRRWRIVATGTLLALCATVVVACQSSPRRRAAVTFHVYDANGTRLTWKAFRARETNGHGDDGVADMLVDPSSLVAIATHPLRPSDDGGDPTFTWPDRATALAVPWPSSVGYSELVVDVPGPGTWNFTEVAAEQQLRQIDAAAARTNAAGNASYTAARNRAADEVAQAQHAGDEAAAGAWGAKALDDLAIAWGALLAIPAPAGTPPVGRAVTFDRPPADPVAATAAVLRQFPSDAGGRWVRVVFDPGEPAGHYAPLIDALHAAGISVLGQILDSSELASTSMRSLQRRTRQLLAAFPSLEEWEVGNEVNGDWVGSGAAAKVSWVARYVRSHSRARTFLTLYWDLGTADAAHSTFRWVDDELPASIRADIDDVGLSVYPDQMPLGTAFVRVWQASAAMFPHAQLWLGELGYRVPDQSPGPWWWGDPRDVAAARVDVARFYRDALASGQLRTGGGTYWWRWLEEAATPGPLSAALAG